MKVGKKNRTLTEPCLKMHWSWLAPGKATKGKNGRKHNFRVWGLPGVHCKVWWDGVTERVDKVGYIILTQYIMNMHEQVLRWAISRFEQAPTRNGHFPQEGAPQRDICLGNKMPHYGRFQILWPPAREFWQFCSPPRTQLRTLLGLPPGWGLKHKKKCGTKRWARNC